VQEAALGIEASGFEGGAAVVGEEGVEKGEEGVDGIEWGAAGASGKMEGRWIGEGEEIIEGGEVGGGGVAFDSAEGVEGGGLLEQLKAVLEEVSGLGEAGGSLGG